MRLVAQNAVAHVVVMGHLHAVEKYDVFKLGGVAHHAVFTDERTAADKGAMPYLAFLGR